MQNFIKLTDYETGEPLHVRPSSITSMRQLVSEQCSRPGDEPPYELGRRTVICVDGTQVCVREDADEIMETISQ